MMKTLLSLLLFCALLPPALADGGFLTNVLRSVTGAVGSKEAPAPAEKTAVLGIRGMDEGETKSSGPVSQDSKLLDSWAVGRTEAEAAAGRRGLAARTVDYPQSTTSPTTGNSPDLQEVK